MLAELGATDALRQNLVDADRDLSVCALEPVGVTVEALLGLV